MTQKYYFFAGKIRLYLFDYFRKIAYNSLKTVLFSKKSECSRAFLFSRKRRLTVTAVVVGTEYKTCFCHKASSPVIA